MDYGDHLNSLLYLSPLPLLQILLVYFALSGEGKRMFFLLLLATLTGLLTFHFILKLKKDKQLDWLLLLYPCFIAAGVLTFPLGVWLMLYTGGGIEAVIIPFLIILPTVMSLFELYHIFRNIRIT